MVGAEIRSVQQQSWWAEYPEEPAVKLWWHPVGRLRMASLPVNQNPLQVLAARMAEPLRQAFYRHLDEHEHPEGAMRCEEAMRLWALLPDGDAVVFA